MAWIDLDRGDFTGKGLVTMSRDTISSGPIAAWNSSFLGYWGQCSIDPGVIGQDTAWREFILGAYQPHYRQLDRHESYERLAAIISHLQDILEEEVWRLDSLKGEVRNCDKQIDDVLDILHET